MIEVGKNGALVTTQTGDQERLVQYTVVRAYKPNGRGGTTYAKEIVTERRPLKTSPKK